MAPERIETSVTLFGTPPWGFRISGGKEFRQPLVVSRVTPGSLASKGGISAGDVVLALDGEYVSGLTQEEFEVKLAKATGSVMLVVEKNGAVVGQDGTVKSRIVSFSLFFCMLSSCFQFVFFAFISRVKVN